MIIVYEGAGETLICDKKDEKKMLKDYFKDGGRDVEEYEREEVSEGVIKISPSYQVDIEK